MRIRAARVGESPMLRELVERAYERYVERIGRRPAPMDADYAARVLAGNAFVAEDDGGIAGLLVLVAGPDHLLVENVAVEPGRQGAGIGRELMAYAERRARSRGLPELRLYTNAAMTENIAFYLRLGYEEAGRRNEEGFRRVFFAKRLTPAAPPRERPLRPRSAGPARGGARGSA
jgi:ribosomal protein S18 acetylase RimI-like enzyme